MIQQCTVHGNQTVHQSNTIAEGFPALQIVVMTECLLVSRVRSMYYCSIQIMISRPRAIQDTEQVCLMKILVVTGCKRYLRNEARRHPPVTPPQSNDRVPSCGNIDASDTAKIPTVIISTSNLYESIATVLTRL